MFTGTEGRSQGVLKRGKGLTCDTKTDSLATPKPTQYPGQTHLRHQSGLICTTTTTTTTTTTLYYYYYYYYYYYSQAHGHTLKYVLISWQARISEMKCRFRGAGGWGGHSAPPSSTPDPKVSTGASQVSQQLRITSESEIRVTSETLSLRRH